MCGENAIQQTADEFGTTVALDTPDAMTFFAALLWIAVLPFAFIASDPVRSSTSNPIAGSASISRPAH